MMDTGQKWCAVIAAFLVIGLSGGTALSRTQTVSVADGTGSDVKAADLSESIVQVAQDRAREAGFAAHAAVAASPDGRAFSALAAAEIARFNAASTAAMIAHAEAKSAAQAQFYASGQTSVINGRRRTTYPPGAYERMVEANEAADRAWDAAASQFQQRLDAALAGPQAAIMAQMSAAVQAAIELAIPQAISETISASGASASVALSALTSAVRTMGQPAFGDAVTGLGLWELMAPETVGPIAVAAASNLRSAIVTAVASGPSSTGVGNRSSPSPFTTTTIVYRG